MKNSRFWFWFSLIIMVITLVSLGFNIQLYKQLSVSKKADIELKNSESQVIVKLIDKSNVSIKFPQKMVAKKWVGQQIAKNLLNITPAPGGFGYWATTDKAIYTVKTDNAFKPATRYQVNLGNKLTSITGKPLDSKQQLNFSGGAFSFDWLSSRYDNKTESTVVEIGFNAPCRAADLKQYLTISPQRQYRIISNGLAKTHKIVLSGGNDGEKLTLCIKAGLPAEHSEFATEKTEFAVFTVNSGNINITTLKPIAENWSYYLQLRLDHAVKTDLLLKYLQITPKVKFKLDRITPNQYKISGQFKGETYYTVTLLKGLYGIDTPALKKAEFKSVLIPKSRPQVKFIDNDRLFLRSNGAMLLPVSTLGVKKVNVKVFKIYNNNLTWFLGNVTRRWYYDDERPSRFYGKKIFNTTLSVKNNQWQPSVSYLNLRKLLKNPQPGLYELFLSLPNSWRSSRQLIVITNLGITCKVADKQLMAYVTDLTTSLPVAGAEVKLLSNKNQQLISGKTDQNGCLMLTIPKLGKGTYPQLLQVQNGKDFSLLNLQAANLKLSTAGFKLHGVNWGKRQLNGFIYTPRNIYRPGEKVTLAAIVRSLPALNTPEKFPVEFKIKRPDGMLFKKMTTMLKTNGFAEITVPLPASARSGWYRVSLSLPGTSAPFGHFKFLVDDFEPDKLQVIVKSPTKHAKPNENINLNIKAEYLFGAPVSSGKVTVRAFCQKMPVSNPKYSKFRFTTYVGETKQASASVKIGKWDLSKAGAKELKTKVLERDMPLNYRIVYAANVISDAGDSSNGYCSVPVIKYQRLVGIRSLTAVPGVNRKTWLLYGLIDGVNYKKVKPLPDRKLQMQVSHTVYHWEKVIENSYVTDRLVPVTNIIAEKLIPAKNALGKFSFIPTKEGEYRVKLTDPTSGHSSEVKLYCYSNYADYLYYSSLGEQQTDKTAANISKITLSCKVIAGNRAKVASGLDETGTKRGSIESLSGKKGTTQEHSSYLLISLKTPIQGQGFITIENGNKIFDLIPFTAAKTVNELILPIKTSYPNSFKIFAAIVNKKRSDAAIKSDFAYGYKQLDMSTEPFELKISGAIPQQVKPGSKMTLKLQLKNSGRPVEQASVTLALVDEGICRLTGFKTPAPLPWFYRPPLLTINSFSSYCALIKETKLKSLNRSEIFYGGGALFAKALYTKRPEDRQTVAIWKSPVLTDKNGRCDVTFSIPQFTGKLRLMVVAFKGRKFGSKQQFITVKNRCVTMTKFPLFVAPEDKVKVPIVLQNSDPQKLYTGTLKVNATEYPFTLTPHAFRTIIYPFTAPLTTGELKFTVKNIAANKKIMFEQAIGVKVRSATPLAIKVTNGRFNTATGELKIKVPGTWSSGTGLFTLATSPKIELKGCWRYLLNYPYGCLEQTISGGFSLFYLPELYTGTLPQEQRNKIHQQRIQGAVNRIMSMQHYDGSFSMWPGATTPWEWGTVYAYDFLTTVQQDGYQVSISRLARTEKYLMRHLVKLNSDSAAYALYLLSRRKNISQNEIMSMYRRIITNNPITDMSKSAHAYLALAMGNAGFTALASQLVDKTKATMIKNSYYQYWENFYADSSLASAVNDRAVTLMMLLAIAPDDPQIPKLVKKLIEYCRQRNYSTHDSAMAIISLVKQQATERRNPVKCQITIMRNNQKLGEFTVKNSESKYLSIKSDELQHGDIVLKATGSGKVYYRYAAIGTPLKPPAPYDNGIEVRRQILNEDGSPAQLDKLQFGQLYIVKVSLKSSKPVNSIVVNDMLPACFQIENSQLLTRDKSTIRNFQNSLKPTRTEPRFDRYLIFCSLAGGEQASLFYYPVRIGYRGTFTLPGIAADSMYDTTIGSRQAGQIIKVE